MTYNGFNLNTNEKWLTKCLSPSADKIRLSVRIRFCDSVTKNGQPADVAIDIFETMLINPGNIFLKTSDGYVLKANKELLSEKSKTFQSIIQEVTTAQLFAFQFQRRPDDTPTINVNFSKTTMIEILSFIVQKTVKNIEHIDVEVLKAAKQYQIEGFEEYYQSSILKVLTETNVLKFVQHADLGNWEELFEKCCKIMQSYVFYILIK